MTHFLAGDDLSAAIKDTLRGNNVRCAVAFWGNGAEALIRQSAGDPPRIICDVTLGGTSPKALGDLGAPGNKHLRYTPRLHAKVYISDIGAVVCSANASNNGIGFSGPPNLMESGVFLAPTTGSYRQAEQWFDVLWRQAEQVDAEAVEIAKKRFRPERQPDSHAVRSGSLLDLVVSDPERFSSLSFVLVENSADKNDCHLARETVMADHPEQADRIAGLRASGMFTGWTKGELSRWSTTFIEFWMPRQQLKVFGLRIEYVVDNLGAIMSRRDWTAVKALVACDLPPLAQVALVDGPVIRRLLDQHGNRLFSANELVAAIESLPDQMPAAETRGR